MSYYNTTSAQGDLLKSYRMKASTQEDLILDCAMSHGCSFASSEAQLSVFQNKVPLTSVRRAITNLTKYGALEKTDKQSQGPYGRPEHKWRAVR
jgi:predicted ArsR family transcriptional regulator